MSRKVRQATDSGCAGRGGRGEGQGFVKEVRRAETRGGRQGGVGAHRRQGARAAAAHLLLHLVAGAYRAHLDVLEDEEQELAVGVVDDLEEADDVHVAQLLHDRHLSHHLRAGARDVRITNKQIAGFWGHRGGMARGRPAVHQDAFILSSSGCRARAQLTGASGS